MSPFFARATISCGWYTTTSQHRLVGAAHPTSLRHDAAEAILIGLWGVLEVGWLDEPSEVAYVDLKIGRSSLANPAANTTPKITGTQRTGSPRRQGDPMAADLPRGRVSSSHSSTITRRSTASRPPRRTCSVSSASHHRQFMRWSRPWNVGASSPVSRASPGPSVFSCPETSCRTWNNGRLRSQSLSPGSAR